MIFFLQHEVLLTMPVGVVKKKKQREEISSSLQRTYYVMLEGPIKVTQGATK